MDFWGTKPSSSCSVASSDLLETGSTLGRARALGVLCFAVVLGVIIFYQPVAQGLSWEEALPGQSTSPHIPHWQQA